MKSEYKTYISLRQKQKARVASWMFTAVCEYYKEHSAMPDGRAINTIAENIYEKVKSIAAGVSYDDVYSKLIANLSRYETRILENSISAPIPTKVKSNIPHKKGSSKKVCPACGRKMKQQFIGLQHCKCGMSWKNDVGFLARTDDMEFALERRKAGTKVKQCPVIRYKN